MTEADTQNMGRLICTMLHCTGVWIFGRGAEEVRNSFLQGPEGILHVLQQLGKVCFDFSLAILYRVLKNPLNINVDYVMKEEATYLLENGTKKKKKRLSTRASPLKAMNSHVP